MNFKLHYKEPVETAYCR